MRSRSTNILQVIIIITGLVYILIGIAFFYSPVKLFQILSVDVTADWFKSIEYDTFIAPMYIFARSFSAMICIIGMSMILPLYDPLKYRGLIYFTGIIYPLVSSVLLLYHGIKSDHWILTLFSIVYFVIFISTMCGLIITLKEARAGIE